jgi:hypothetical protein
MDVIVVNMIVFLLKSRLALVTGSGGGCVYWTPPFLVDLVYHIFCFQIFILHNSRCQVPCGSCKKLPPYFTYVLLYFSGPSGSLMPALWSVENWVPLKPVLGGVRDVARIHYPSCTDSIKPSVQFSCNFVVINASKGTFFQIFLLEKVFILCPPLTFRKVFICFRGVGMKYSYKRINKMNVIIVFCQALYKFCKIKRYFKLREMLEMPYSMHTEMKTERCTANKAER